MYMYMSTWGNSNTYMYMYMSTWGNSNTYMYNVHVRHGVIVIHTCTCTCRKWGNSHVVVVVIAISNFKKLKQ